MDPLVLATKCLGPAKLVHSRGGRHVLHVDHVWSLNGERGAALRGGWHFEAQMHYRIIPVTGGGYRVTTRAYRYRIAHLGPDIVRLHWHPIGNSPVKYPHMHAALTIHGGVSSSLDQHFPTGRMTYEDAIRFLATGGAPLARVDYLDVLAEAEAQHLEHRTWEHHAPDGHAP